MSSNLTLTAKTYDQNRRPEKTEEKNRGTISIIRIDGTNKTEIYNNTMYSDNVYSGPGGDKLIMLTTFKSTGATNLYTLGIR